MLKKNAQISIFITIGVVILLVFILLTFASNSVFDIQKEIPFDRESINSFITGCMQITAEEAVFLVGKQGGFSNPTNYLQSKNFKIPFLYDKGTNKVPSKEQVANEIAEYVNQKMLFCLDNFRSFEQQGWTVSYEQPITSVSLNQRDISVTQEFLISVQKDATITFQRFSHTIPVRLGYLIDIANEIVAFHEAEPGWTDLTALSEHDVDITVFPYQQHLMYSLEDKASKLRLETYLFNFALDFE